MRRRNPSRMASRITTSQRKREAGVSLNVSNSSGIVQQSQRRPVLVRPNSPGSFISS